MADATTYPVEGLITPDPAWPERFAQLADALQAELGPAWRIEHIGSTSVPGLLSKPVIDLALRIPDDELLNDHTDCFRRAGWSEPVGLASHQVSFLLDGTVRRAIAHVFTSDQWPSAHQRLFASWLRRHPDDRDAYARLKQGLHDKGVWGREYTAAKTAFVQDIVNRARAAQGLSPIPLGQDELGARGGRQPRPTRPVQPRNDTQAGRDDTIDPCHTRLASLTPWSGPGALCRPGVESSDGSRPQQERPSACSWPPMAAGGSSTGLTGPGRLDPRVETEAPDQVLGRLTVTGTSRDMPAAVYQPQPVDVLVDRATITSGLTEVRLPLETLTISRASSVPRPLTRRKAVDAVWVIDVTGPETSLSFRGRWLVLAYLGTLAGWPEPD